MTNLDIDVIGIGNALVDVLTHEEDEFVEEQGLIKGSMTLIDAARAEDLYSKMGPATEVSGGSAANTIVGVTAMGGNGAYIGKVRDDQLGAIFAHDMRSMGLTFDVEPASSGDPTGRCMILVTPDGQRTMSTYLGASVSLAPDDIDPSLIRRGKILFLEGYLWDPPHAKAAMRAASELAVDNGQKVALTLSDSFCVERHRDSFLHLVDNSVDVLFANEAEALSLFEVDNLEAVYDRAAQSVEIAVITRSEKGSVVVAGGERVVVAAEPVAKVVDTTGAGDLYASGFLIGLARGADMATCARLGSIAAAEIISHMGPRPEADLLELVGDLLPPA
ncbi:MAG: adenosine kinase [Actinomycetia bacterium]|nr:adenosine kinase [Actinomycetes bacterium]MCP4959337.1 adenosine kinase [Actinomycetes bacterium]